MVIEGAERVCFARLEPKLKSSHYARYITFLERREVFGRKFSEVQVACTVLIRLCALPALLAI
jgi:hypothetical protein